MTTPRLPAAIEAEEGRESAAYPDPLSPLGGACECAGLRMADYRQVPGWASLDGAPWTIGVGQTGPDIHQGLVWSDAQIDAARDASIARAESGLDQYLPWWRKLSDVRQDALVSVTFQLGIHGLVAFHRSLTALEDGLYDQAADDFLQSLWAKQTPARAKRVTDLIRTGAYPS